MGGRTGAEIVLDVLTEEGVEVVFGYPGGTIMPLYDALYEHGIKHILVRHEAAAAFAASGYARTTRRVGVCLATSGPGATNLVTGIADAMLDNVPLLAITGQVRTSVMGTDAFQEVDIAGITQGVTKRNEVVRRVEDLELALRRAFRSARGPRPGPVLVDIPTDVLKARLDESNSSVSSGVSEPCTTRDSIRNVYAATVTAIARSEKPVIIVGGGARWSGAIDEYRAFLELLGAPHCTTLHGLGAAGFGDPSFLGMAGMHGTKRANLAIEQTDCLIALGMRFDDRITGDPKRFAPNALNVIHADIDPSEFDKNVKATIKLPGDLKQTLTQINSLLKAWPLPSFAAWRDNACSLSEQLPCDPSHNQYLSATDVLDAFFNTLPSDAIVTTDVGQHQMWAAQRARPRDMSSFISSGGLGSMGFGFPAAIGAQIAHPTRSVYCVVGDGGFQMSMAELATIRRYGLPVKILLIDNAHLGMVRQWQQLFFESRYSETYLPENPDFTILAHAYGIRSGRIEAGSDVRKALARFAEEQGPALLHCSCHPHENVWPMIPSGTSTAHMMEALPA